MKKLYVALVCILVVGVLRAQSPGGVGTNLSVWLKPDGLAAGTLGSWTYSNNGSNQYTTVAGSEPTVVANAFNFLPAVNFNGSQYMSGPNGAGAPIPLNQLAYSVFAVWSSSVAVGGGNMRVWAQRPANGASGDVNFDGASLFVFPNGQGSGYTSTPTYGDQPEVNPYISGVAIANTGSTPYTYFTSILNYAPGTPYISSMNLLNQDANDLELMDQSNYGSGPGVTSTDPFGTATANRKLATDANLLGMRSIAGDEALNGNLAELIIYSGSVNATQRNQIFSYLALKYGITLNGNYYSSTGQTIWDATANGSYGSGSFNYNHFVFGIGQDNASGLMTTQSNSLATGSGGGAGQSGAGNITLANPASLGDQGFLIVGSNNAGFAETTTNLPSLAGPGSLRLANQWLIQNSGGVGNVDVSVDFTGIPTTGAIGTSSDFRLVVDNDGDGDFTSGSQTYYGPSTWNGNVATFRQITPNNSLKTVFTVLSSATTGTPLPVTWVNFTAIPNGANVNLSWTVGANQEAKVYEVQRSADGTNFTNIGEVANDVAVKSYGFVDAGVGSGTYYYRVLEVDLGGASIYSKIVSVNMSAAAFAIKLLNNPTITSNTDAELQLTTNTSSNVLMEVWTLSGSRVGSFQQAVGAGVTTMRVPLTGLAAGTYAVKITANNNTQTVQVVKL